MRRSTKAVKKINMGICTDLSASQMPTQRLLLFVVGRCGCRPSISYRDIPAIFVFFLLFLCFTGYFATVLFRPWRYSIEMCSYKKNNADPMPCECVHLCVHAEKKGVGVTFSMCIISRFPFL